MRGPPTTRAWLLPWALAALAAGTARADPLYVIEQLVVSVSSAPDASGEHIATLKSGDKVELIERAGDEVHVRLASGKEGWVRASYLSADEPLRVRLAQREAEVAQLQEQVDRLQGQLRAHPPTAASVANAPGGAPAPASTVVPGNAAAAVGDAPAPSAPAEDPAPPAEAMFSQATATHPRQLWPWTLAAALLGLAAGFAVGVLVLDRHIRRKYGGLRIY